MTAPKAATLACVTPLTCRVALVAVLLGGCFGPQGPRSTRTPGQTPPATGSSPTEPPTTLLAAHAQPPGPADRDYAMPVAEVVYLVFSRPIDPMSLAPHSFVLALPSGQRISPIGAFLGPAQERDEHRTVELLLSDSRKDQSAPMDPISVTVTGLVHDVDGRELEGLSIDVAGPARPVFAVQAVTMATTTTCRGFDHAVRVYWSAPIRRPDDAPAPRVALLEGLQVTPHGVDDVDEPGDDNVIDYCLRGPGNVRWIDVPAGAVVDLRGAPAAKAGLVVQSFGPPLLSPQHVAAPVATPAS